MNSSDQTIAFVANSLRTIYYTVIPAKAGIQCLLLAGR
jgi:hypothetical protein